jgi:hypothetical protein
MVVVVMVMMVVLVSAEPQPGLPLADAQMMVVMVMVMMMMVRPRSGLFDPKPERAHRNSQRHQGDQDPLHLCSPLGEVPRGDHTRHPGMTTG